MSIQQFCQCKCHRSTAGSYWCGSCASMHGQIPLSFEVNSTIDYDSSIYSTLNEIKSILTDIKKILEKKSNGRRGTKSRKTSRSKS